MPFWELSTQLSAQYGIEFCWKLFILIIVDHLHGSHLLFKQVEVEKGWSMLELQHKNCLT